MAEKIVADKAVQLRDLSDTDLLMAYAEQARITPEADLTAHRMFNPEEVRLHDLRWELKRRMESWREFALYLADCEAATAYDFAERKSSSKYETRRHASICKTILDGLKAGGMLINRRPSDKDGVMLRLGNVVTKITERFGEQS